VKISTITCSTFKQRNKNLHPKFLSHLSEVVIDSEMMSARERERERERINIKKLDSIPIEAAATRL